METGVWGSSEVLLWSMQGYYEEEEGARRVPWTLMQRRKCLSFLTNVP
jgi:hypothetical protein